MLEWAFRRSIELTERSRGPWIICAAAPAARRATAKRFGVEIYLISSSIRSVAIAAAFGGPTLPSARTALRLSRNEDMHSRLKTQQGAGKTIPVPHAGIVEERGLCLIAF